MNTKRSSTPNLSYREILEIDLDERGTFRIVLKGDEVTIRLKEKTGIKRKFIDADTASAHCGHEDPWGKWTAGWDNGYAAAEHEKVALQRAVDSWHDDNHAGPSRFCHLEPCHAVRQAEEDTTPET